MKAFEYAEGRTEAEILELLSPHAGHTEIIAGGTDLVGLMKKMVVNPERVVNILEVDSLQQIERLPDGSVVIGAVVRLDELLDSPYLADFGGDGSTRARRTQAPAGSPRESLRAVPPGGAIALGRPCGAHSASPSTRQRTRSPARSGTTLSSPNA